MSRNAEGWIYIIFFVKSISWFFVKHFINFFSAGGLVTAVAPVVIDCDGLWVGWTGLHDFNPAIEKIPESDADDRAPTAGLLSRQAISGDFPSFLFQNLFKRMFWFHEFSFLKWKWNLLYSINIIMDAVMKPIGLYFIQCQIELSSDPIIGL